MSDSVTWVLSDLDLVVLLPWSRSPVLAAAPDETGVDRAAKEAGLADLVARGLIGPDRAYDPLLSLALDVRREPDVIAVVEIGEPLIAHVSFQSAVAVLERAQPVGRALLTTDLDDACFQLALTLCEGGRCVLVRAGDPPQQSVVDVAVRGEGWRWHSGRVELDVSGVPAVAALLRDALTPQGT